MVPQEYMRLEVLGHVRLDHHIIFFPFVFLSFSLMLFHSGVQFCRPAFLPVFESGWLAYSSHFFFHTEYAIWACAIAELLRRMATERTKRCSPVAPICRASDKAEGQNTNGDKGYNHGLPRARGVFVCLESREDLHAVGPEAGGLKMVLGTPRLLFAPAGEMSGRYFLFPSAAEQPTTLHQHHRQHCTAAHHDAGGSAKKREMCFEEASAPSQSGLR